jgi:hypothetical protein
VSSATLCAATDGFTTAIIAAVPMSETGAKSLIGSYGSFLNRLWFAACSVLVLMSTV